MSKILVIEDEFIDELYSYLPLVGKPLPAERKRLKALFKRYEREVIEFEAKVEKALPLNATSKMLELSWLELPQDKFKRDEDVQVFVVKKEKHETDKT